MQTDPSDGHKMKMSQSWRTSPSEMSTVFDKSQAKFQESMIETKLTQMDRDYERAVGPRRRSIEMKEEIMLEQESKSQIKLKRIMTSAEKREKENQIRYMAISRSIGNLHNGAKKFSILKEESKKRQFYPEQIDKLIRKRKLKIDSQAKVLNFKDQNILSQLHNITLKNSQLVTKKVLPNQRNSKLNPKIVLNWVDELQKRIEPLIDPYISPKIFLSEIKRLQTQKRSLQSQIQAMKAQLKKILPFSYIMRMFHQQTSPPPISHQPRIKKQHMDYSNETIQQKKQRFNWFFDKIIILDLCQIQQIKDDCAICYGKLISANDEKQDKENQNQKYEKMILISLFSEQNKEKQVWVEKEKMTIIDSNPEVQTNKSKAQIVQLYCGHIFHKQCVKTWLQLNPNCPICRKDFRMHIEYKHFDPEYKKRILSLKYRKKIDERNQKILAYENASDLFQKLTTIIKKQWECLNWIIRRNIFLDLRISDFQLNP